MNGVGSHVLNLKTYPMSKLFLAKRTFGPLGNNTSIVPVRGIDVLCITSPAEMVKFGPGYLFVPRQMKECVLSQGQRIPHFDEAWQQKLYILRTRKTYTIFWWQGARIRGHSINTRGFGKITYPDKFIEMGAISLPQ